MQPTESTLYPDLVLSVSSQFYRENSELIKGLEKGDEVQFRAKVMNLGSEFKMHHLHIEAMTKTGKRIQL